MSFTVYQLSWLAYLSIAVFAICLVCYFVLKLIKMKKIIFSIIIAVIAVTCYGQDVWVSSTGNDNNNGSKSAPFRTLGRGLSVIPIDSFHVMPGTYTEYINKLTFGADGKEISIAAPYQTVTITFKGNSFILQDDNNMYSVYTELKESSLDIKPWTINSEPVYYNTSYTTYINKNDCPTGYTGSREYYVVVAKLYRSLISQVDAQNKAKADALRNKQLWANQVGSCTKL